MDVVVPAGVEALAEDPPARDRVGDRRRAGRRASRAAPPRARRARRMLATLIDMRSDSLQARSARIIDASPCRTCGPVRRARPVPVHEPSGPKQMRVMSSTWTWPAENSRMSWRMARPTASGPPEVSASLRSSRRLSRDVVELLAEVAGVGHAVGEDGDDVAGRKLDLGLLVVGVGHDPQREAGDLLADLLDRARWRGGSGREGARRRRASAVRSRCRGRSG